MNTNEIKQAIEAGKQVCWAADHYKVIKDRIGQFLILCETNESCIGLTSRDGSKLNGNEEDFYILGE